MSTFFHSAAMSLLSRTLQTILSKYLSDVDVEGVALPLLSTGSSSTGGNSGSSGKTSSHAGGWGVRLSNVKLRDGTKLYDLPGKQKKRTKPSAAKRNKAPTRKTNKVTNNAFAHPETRDGSATTTESPSEPDHPFREPAEAGTHHGGGDCSSAPPLPKNTLPLVNDQPAVSEPMVATSSTERIETNVDAVTTANPKSSASKVLRRKSSWFSSWYYGTASSNDEEPLIERHDDQEPSTNSCSKFAEENGNENNDAATSNKVRTNGDHNNNFGTDAACMRPSTESGDPLFGTLPAEKDDSFGLQSTTDDDYQENDDQQQDDEDEPDDDYPMVLRLGKGGTIGTLDVRLVGKTVHVLVEDAFLTLEAVRLAPPPTAANDDDGYETTPPPDGKASAKKKKPTAASDPKTTGDRVLAENAIARLFSVIPNLFLRDIRVRLVIRDQVVTEWDEYDDDTERDTSTAADDEASLEYDSNDTVIELSIELLSVNDGKDFLLNFGGTVDEDDFSSSSDDDDESAGERTGEMSGVVSSTLGVETANEFLTKRIRTGRGPEGGILLKIYQAGEELYNNFGETRSVMWARDVWNASTELVVVRCSGLDLQARIFLGTKKEIAISNHGYYAEEYEYYDDFEVDAMLFGGVDYIVPGPQPPLPPISNDKVANLSTAAENWADTGATTFFTDSNGIQSCRLPSPFHKVARGLVPRHCSGTHLPCEACHRCWAKDAGSARPHVLDASTPLGGLVFHVSVRDPLEINVDRYNLAVLGLLLSIFTKTETEDEQDEARQDDNSDDVSITALRTDSQRSSQSIDESYRSMGVSGRSVRSLARAPSTLKKYEDFNVESSFPTYMQPEKIQMLGLHLAEIQFRVHVMQKDGESEGGKSYCYWDLHGKSVTMDYQTLNASERPFQDLRFDVGHLTVAEFKGVQRKQIISLGVRQRVVEFDDITVETFMTSEKNHKRSPWPTTAAALLDVPPPLESLVYADRERHGLQLRYISVLDPREDCSRIRKDANLRVGTATVDVEFAIKNDIMLVIEEARSSVLGPPKTGFSSGNVPKPVDSIMKYKLIADGGRVCMEPLISASLPMTTVEGEISSEAGFSLRAMLDQCQVSYGKPSAIRALDVGLSLQELSKLPDNVRLRVLLFLKDLKPLEAALGLTEASNSFLRCRAVNKGIVNMSKKVERRMSILKTDQTEAPVGRRQELMNELLVLDDDTLEDLVEAHRRNQRRAASGRF